jgi:selenocysteine-specific elongation factor
MTKVRGLQSHGESLKTAHAGQRVAMNLQGIAKEDVQRGDVITLPGKIMTSLVVDAELEMLKDVSIPSLKSRTLVHFHTGTSELVGRIIIYDREALKPGEKAYCQFRFKSPITVMAGDRYIIRRFSPLMTIGGGEVIDVTPRRRRRQDKIKELGFLFKGDLKEKLAHKILQSGLAGTTQDRLTGWIKAEVPESIVEINALIRSGIIIDCEGTLLHRDIVDDFRERAISSLTDFHMHNPLKPGMLKEALKAVFIGIDQKVFESLLKRIDDVVLEKEIIRLKSFSISLSEDKKLNKDKILRALEQAVFQPPAREDLARSMSMKGEETAELLKIMAAEKSVVRINDSLYISMSNYTKMMDRLQDFYQRKQEMTVGEFRDVLGTSRKYAIPFLEYLDSNKITLRVGEVRKFLKK